MTAPSPLKEELHCELHGAWVRLNIGDPAELAPKDVNGIRASIRVGRQAPGIIRDPQVLMVQRVEDVPAELEIFAFRKRRINALSLPSG